jgi:hypothetical protein
VLYLPVEYQCSRCQEYKSVYETFFCLHCQDIICKECSESEPLRYKCFRCGTIYTKEEARNNFTECIKCYNCIYCEDNLKIEYGNDRYYFKCNHCGWKSDNQDPIIVNEDKLKLINLSRNSLKNERLYEDYRILCPVCKGTLVNTLEEISNTIAEILPKFVFRTRSFPLNTDFEIPYTVRNPRPEGAFFRLDWYSKEGEYDISINTRSAEFDFHAPFIKMPKNNKISIKAFKIGENYLWADLAYKFDEIKYGIGKTKLRLGPIYVYPKIEINRHVNKPIKSGEENSVYIFVKNDSNDIIKQLIISDMILEGTDKFNRLFWEVKDLKPGEEVDFKYNFIISENSKKIKFDSLRAKIRFSSFMPHMFFDFVNPVEYVELD